MAARARNALRRPVFITAVSVMTFAASLLALVIVPQQARKAADALRPPSALRPDTEPTMSALREAQRQVAAAEASIAQARAELLELVEATVAVNATDTAAGGALITADVRARRDSLTSQVELLTRLITRSENAPLLGSYRALAQAAPMQGDPRVKPVLDSLVEIERERESYSAVGGVDPVFVALTARANELGRNIEALADARRIVIRQQLAALAPPPPVAPAAIATRPLPDTLARMRDLEAARTAAAGVASRLALERRELTELDAREARAQDLASVGASPSAILAAALVFGAVLGFGVALFDEVRRPRVADAFEAERATGVRVVGIIRPLAPSPERGRRSADRAGPPYLDAGGDGHQLIYLTLATAGSNTLMLTVTGDSPDIAAVVAVNFAAIAADEARATLLVDADGTASSVTNALRLRPGPGLAALVNGSAEWPEVTRNTRVGRDRTIDVVTSGDASLTSDQVNALLASDLARLSRRYDAIIVVASPEQVVGGLAAAMPVPDVLYCARAGQLPILDLQRTTDEIVNAGGNLRGLALWNAPNPMLGATRKAETARLEPATVG